MFDIGFWELTLIGVIALLVLGPERLPRAARTAGLWLAKARRAVTTMKTDIERELDLAELKRIGNRPDLSALQEIAEETRSALSEGRHGLEHSRSKTSDARA